MYFPSISYGLLYILEIDSGIQFCINLHWVCVYCEGDLSQLCYGSRVEAEEKEEEGDRNNFNICFSNHHQSI